MAKLTLSKSAFLNESKKLEGYQRFLPSLDLKRKQLVIEQAKEAASLTDFQEKLASLKQQSANELQMLSNQELEFDDLVKVKTVSYGEENRLGVVLPVVSDIDIEVKPYGLLTKPHWVDVLVKRLVKACELSVHQKVAEQRVDVMRNATRKATQRVNLVSKILIPEAKKNIRKIQIFLSDNERAAVVRSKIAKKKKLKLASMTS